MIVRGRGGAGRSGEGEIVIRTYYMKKIYFQWRRVKEQRNDNKHVEKEKLVFTVCDSVNFQLL